MHLKLLSVFAAALLLVACESTPETAGTGTGTGQTPPPAASGPTTQPAGPVPGSSEDFVVNVGDRVFFDYDKFDLKADARRTLDRQVAWLKRYNRNVTLEGHADERGTRDYNLALGERRANSVRDYLVAQGITPNRVRTVSYGKERPAVPGSNEAAWAQNRRGVTVPQ